MHIFDETDFKPKSVRRDKDGHFILIKGIIYQVEITMVKLYSAQIGIPNLVR
jgi:hypothetical protein